MAQIELRIRDYWDDSYLYRGEQITYEGRPVNTVKWDCCEKNPSYSIYFTDASVKPVVVFSHDAVIVVGTPDEPQVDEQDDTIILEPVTTTTMILYGFKRRAPAGAIGYIDRRRIAEVLPCSFVNGDAGLWRVRFVGEPDHVSHIVDPCALVTVVIRAE